MVVASASLPDHLSDEGTHTLEVFVDRSIVEVYVDGGAAVLVGCVSFGVVEK